MTDTTTRRHPIDELADEFVERYRQGERPTLSEFAAAHPEYAEDIREVFPALVMLEECGPNPGEDSEWASVESSPIQLGEYRIIREIGRGGMGIVYEAEQQSLGRHVALKVFPFASLMDSAALKRFRREVRAAARLHHTNIVPVFGIGKENGIHYYAMQYIEGQGLDAVLQEVRNLREGSGQGDRNPISGAFPREIAPTDETKNVPSGSTELKGASASNYEYYRGVARIGRQVADALAHAHLHGILHRDIKPSNLLMDVDGTIWITDFGLAKTEDDGLTHTGDIVGTLRYMAPERLQGWSDPRSDVYSLGLTLYELLLLHPAFEEKERGKLMKQIMLEEPARPRRLEPGLPRDLETIILKSIAKEPAHRYQTAAEMASDLGCFLNDKPIVARRASWSNRTWLWCRRNPAVAGLLGLVAGLLIAVTSISTYSAIASGVLVNERTAALEKAEGRLSIAFSAIENFLTRLGERSLVHVPRMEEERRRILEDALAFHQEILGEEPENPAIRVEMGRAYRRVGKIHQLLGSLEPAESALMDSAKLFSDLLEEQPDREEWLYELARARTLLGRIFAQTGRTQEAEVEWTESRDILIPIARKSEADPEWRRTLANCHGSLGILCKNTGRMQDAEKHYDAARAIEIALVSEHAGNPIYEHELARTYGNQFILFFLMGRFEESENAGKAALGMLESLVQAHPEDTEYLKDLGSTHENLGNLYMSTERPNEGEQSFRSGLEHRDRLVRDFPSVPEHTVDLATSQSNLGTLLANLGRTDEGIAYLEQATQAFSQLAEGNPKVLLYRVRQGGALSSLGHACLKAEKWPESERAYQKSADVMEELVKEVPQVPIHQSYLGMALAGLAETLRRSPESLLKARSLIERAIRAQKVAMGPNPNNPQTIRLFVDHCKTLGRIALDQGDHQTAAQAATDMVVGVPSRHARPMDAAELLARCAEAVSDDNSERAEQYAAQAVDFLKTASERDKQLAEKIAENENFEILKGREDYQALIESESQ